MLLIDFTALIQQFIPIHWRHTYRENLLKVLLSPLISLYQRFQKYQQQRSTTPLSYLQTGVLEYYLNTYYTAIGYLYVEIIDTNTPASFQISVHPQYQNKVKDIETFVQSKIPIGTQFNIIVRQ